MEPAKRPNIFVVFGRFVADRTRVAWSHLGEELMQIPIVSWDMLRLVWRRLDQFVGRNFHRLATGARIEPAALDNLGLAVNRYGRSTAPPEFKARPTR